MATVLPLVRKQGRNRRMGTADVLPGTLATRQRQTLTGMAGQKQFTVAGGYSVVNTVALLDVYINGVYITEYTATDGSTFTLSDGLDSANDEVVVVASLLNTLGSSTAFAFASETGYSTGTTTASAIPSSVLVGQLMLLLVMHRGALTTPSGWSLVTSQQNGTSTGITQYLSCLSKVAVASDPGSTVNLVQSVSDRIAASFSCYRKTQGSPSVKSFGTTSTSGSSSFPAAAVTSTSTDQVVLFCQTATLAITAGATTYASPSDTSQITLATGNDVRLCVGYVAAGNKLETGSFTNNASSTNDTASISLVIG